MTKAPRRERTIKTTKRERKVALQYLIGEITRADLNRAFKYGAHRIEGLHKVARAVRDLADENPALMAELSRLLKDA